MQYRRFRFDSYLVEAFPVTATEMMVRIRRKFASGFQTLERIVADATAQTLMTEYGAAVSEAALNTWYAGQLTTLASLVDPD